MDPILKIRDISLSFGGVKALSNVTFDVKDGELLSIIGPNGAGWTCVINCLNKSADRNRVQLPSTVTT